VDVRSPGFYTHVRVLYHHPLILITIIEEIHASQSHLMRRGGA
jgi:AraC-like DNA-binding protein